MPCMAGLLRGLCGVLLGCEAHPDSALVRSLAAHDDLELPVARSQRRLGAGCRSM